jgi:hypothetical protein
MPDEEGGFSSAVMEEKAEEQHHQHLQIHFSASYCEICQEG